MENNLIQITKEIIVRLKSKGYEDLILTSEEYDKIIEGITSRAELHSRIQEYFNKYHNG